MSKITQIGFCLRKVQLASKNLKAKHQQVSEFVAKRLLSVLVSADNERQTNNRHESTSDEVVSPHSQRAIGQASEM